MIQAVIAFFWADEPDALIEPVAQLVLELPEADDEPPPLSEPQAARASAPASVTAAMVAVRLMVTESSVDWVWSLTSANVGRAVVRLGGPR